MSDDPDLAAESAEATQSVTDPGSSETPAPWGDDFDPARAWQTITHLRGREKELESEANRFKRIREDEAARREFLTELGYELEDDQETDTDDDVDVDETPVADPRVDELAQWVRQKQEKEARDAFDAHLDTLANADEENPVKLSARDRRTILAESIANGFEPSATEKAFKEFIEDRQALLDQLRESEQERIQKKKGAPHISPVGSGASDVKNVVDMTDAERVAYMRERFARAQRGA